MSLLEFEIRASDGKVAFVEVIDEFVHHYTKEIMRYIRIHYVENWFGETNAYAEYNMVNEKQFSYYLERRIQSEDP